MRDVQDVIMPRNIFMVKLSVNSYENLFKKIWWFFVSFILYFYSDIVTVCTHKNIINACYILLARKKNKKSTWNIWPKDEHVKFVLAIKVSIFLVAEH
jgi:hypothetical protein